MVLVAISLAVATSMVTHRAAAAEKPRRIVSLNLCADQLLVDLVARDRIAAVSILGPDPQMSAAAGRLAGVPTVPIDAERVLALDPDLVVTGEWAPPAVHLLRRLGRRVVTVPTASDVPGLERAITTLAAAVGEAERGAAVVGDLRRALTEAARIGEPTFPAVGPKDSAPTAMALQVNSIVSGSGTLIDALLTVAGFRNAAATRSLGPGGRLPLEVLVAAPPDVIVLSNAKDDFLTPVADNLRHPAFAAVTASRPTVHIPMRLWLCATPAMTDAVAALARARDALGAMPSEVIGKPAGATR